MTLHSGGDMSQSSAWSYLVPGQLLTTCEEPVGQCQALGNYLPSTWTPPSQNSVYLGTIPCPWELHLSSWTSWDFTPENSHVLISLKVTLGLQTLQISFLTWAIPKPAVFPPQVTDVGGRHRERGGQGKQVQPSLTSLCCLSESWLKWCLTCGTDSWVKNIILKVTFTVWLKGAKGLKHVIL